MGVPSSIVDVCRFNPTTGGVTDWTVASNVAGYLSPAAAGMVNGSQYSYRAESVDLSQWEVGTGIYNSSLGVLTRAIVLFNSAGTTAKIDFSGAPQVAAVALKEDLLSFNSAMALTPSQMRQACENIGAYRPSYVINGAMRVSEENGSAPGSGSGYYPCEMFSYWFSMSAVCNVAQVTSRTPGGSPNRLRVVVATAQATVGANDFAVVRTKIEGVRIAALGFGTSEGRQCVLRFGVKAPAGTYSVSFRNAAATRSFIASFSIATANVDTVISIPLNADTAGNWLSDSGTGLDVCWCLMAGSSSAKAPGPWATDGTPMLASAGQGNFMAAVGNTFELFDVGLYDGAIAPPFVVPDIADDLRHCRRYYWKNTAMLVRTFARNSGEGYRFASIKLPSTMRASPTSLIFGYIEGGASVTWGIETADRDMVSVFVATGSTSSIANINSVEVQARL